MYIVVISIWSGKMFEWKAEKWLLSLMLYIVAVKFYVL